MFREERKEDLKRDGLPREDEDDNEDEDEEDKDAYEDEADVVEIGRLCCS